MNREARIDGNNDPTRPIIPPKINAQIIKSNVTLKLNAISLNVTQFDVPVDTKFNGSASTIPITAPIKAIAIARSYLREEGADIVCQPAFIGVVIDDETRTAIGLHVTKRQ